MAWEAWLHFAQIYATFFIAPLGIMWLWDHPHNPLFAWAAFFPRLGMVAALCIFAVRLIAHVIARKRGEA